jgi:shikimate dehydrogenase
MRLWRRQLLVGHTGRRLRDSSLETMGAKPELHSAWPAPLITGHTQLIAHIGYPTGTFKSPMIYNPYFAKAGINAVVVPMGCRPDNFVALLTSLFALTNLCGALITMPHKVSVVDLLDESSDTVKVAGSCNAVKKNAQGQLVGDMFDGEGFVRGLLRQKVNPVGQRALINGCGGVGSAIAASLAKAGVTQLQLHDLDSSNASSLARRINQYIPQCHAMVGAPDPHGFDIIVNCTPLGMNDTDPLPFDVKRIAASTYVGEVVMKTELTPLLVAAKNLGCRHQVGIDMLFEQIPAYLEFFGLPGASPEVLRDVAQLSYT